MGGMLVAEGWCIAAKRICRKFHRIMVPRMHPTGTLGVVLLLGLCPIIDACIVGMEAIFSPMLPINVIRGSVAIWVGKVCERR